MAYEKYVHVQTDLSPHMHIQVNHIYVRVKNSLKMTALQTKHVLLADQPQCSLNPQLC